MEHLLLFGLFLLRLLPSIRIVFAQTFGGDAEVGHNFIMFNISPLELWVDGKKYEDFPRLVYHFRGNYE